jgi:hypothetical protein
MAFGHDWVLHGIEKDDFEANEQARLPYSALTLAGSCFAKVLATAPAKEPPSWSVLFSVEGRGRFVPFEKGALPDIARKGAAGC